MKIITNEKNNHLSYIKKIASKSDNIIIASPFLAEDITKLITEMPTIKNITLYTTLQKYADTAHKIITLYHLYEYCNKNEIELNIKIDDNLHGKVYLFYKGITERGFLLTSGNFTENGLVNNHEYGIYIENAEKQKEMKDILLTANTYDLSYKQLSEIYKEAVGFIEKQIVVKTEKFKVNKFINKKPSVTQKGKQRFFIKPVGTSKKHFVESDIIKDGEKLGFGSYPRAIRKGDILLLHSVGPSSIVGYYAVTSDEPVKEIWSEDDRWPWKVEVECHSSKFTENWWHHNLKTRNLVNEFLEINPGKHITEAGGDTVGGLLWGSDKLQITKEFAQFIFEKINV